MKQPNPPYDPFPNCKGLSSELGLTKADSLPSKSIVKDGVVYLWYSICSIHANGDMNCQICRVGAYHPK